MHKSVVVARAELVRETRSFPMLTRSVILSGNVQAQVVMCTRCSNRCTNNFKTRHVKKMMFPHRDLNPGLAGESRVS